MKFNLHGILAGLTTFIGIVSSPAVAHVLPPKAAAIVTAVGAVYAMFSKPAVEKKTK